MIGRDWDHLPPKLRHSNIRAWFVGDHLEEVAAREADDQYVRLWALPRR